ncbi:MAG: hypothetical protein H6587_07275 [Flavobacteriales bacterium]|nr:hypothetical protein [Flavobacteriales bacterium]
MSSNYQILIQKLDAFIRKYYKNRLLKGGIYSLALLLGLFILLTTIEYFAQFNTTGRTIIFYSFFALAGYILVQYFFIPILKLYKFGKVINHQQAAEIIGRHFTDVKDKLTNVLQLQEMAINQENQLVIAGIDQKSVELKPIPFTDAVNLKENVKHLKYAAIPLFLMLIISIFSPNIFQVSTNRLINHNTEIKPIAPFQINIENKKLSVLKNKDFELKITLSGKEIPNKLYISQKGIKMPFSKKSNTFFSFTFKNVQEAQSFSIYASGFDSDEHVLEVLPNPILTQFKMELTYPKYIGKPAETIENNGDLIVPEGTVIKWQIETEDADQLLFLLLDSSIALNPTNKQVVFSTSAKQNFKYSFVPSNKKVSFGDTISYAVQVIPDQYPTIQVEEKQDSLNEKRVYFKGKTEDDYGFSRLTFNCQILTKIDSLPNRNDKAIIEMPVSKTLLADDFFHFWNMETMNILPGDEVAYYFEIWDNDGFNGRKSVKTSVKTYRLKTLQERDEKADKSNENIKNQLSESIDGAKELKKEVEELRKKMAEKKELGWEEKEKIKELIDKQKELEKKLAELKLENQTNNQQQNEYKKYNEDILKKQELLQKLFDELMTDEMKEMMKKLEEMMEKLDKNALENELEKMDESNIDLEKELDRSLELFKQMEFEQKLEEAKNKMEKLAEEQNKLAEQTENKEQDNEKLADKQEELKKEFEELKKDLNELKEKDEQLERPKGFDEMKEQQEETSDDMQKSSEQLNNKKNKKSAESQKSAAEKMEQMAQKMKDMQSEESEGEDMDALRQLLENLLHLSFDQEALMEKFKTVKRESPEYVKLSQHQKKLKDDAKMIEDSLFALSKRVVQLESTINKEIRAINSNMAKAIGFMQERQTPMVVSRQQYIMTSINNLALLFDEALQQMQQQAQQKPGEGSCDNPGGSGKPKPGAGSVRSMQEQLNKQLDDLKKALEEGKKPGGKKGEKEGQGMPGGKGAGSSESFAKAAAQQAKIRDQLQKMRNEMNKAGKSGVDQMSKLMEETETDLVNKRITQQTINRQKEILTRLLESEKADREREFDDKRESTEGKNANFSNPELYFEYNRKKDQEVDLLKATPPNFNLFYKKKVSQYFQKIKQ